MSVEAAVKTHLEGRPAHKLTPVVVEKIQFLTSCWIADLSSCSDVVPIWPHFLAMWATPQGNLQHGSWLHESWGEGQREEGKEKKREREKFRVFYNLISGVIAHHFYHLLFIRSQSVGLGQTQREGNKRREWTQEEEILGCRYGSYIHIQPEVRSIENPVQ